MVAETPLSELWKSEVSISKCKPIISNGEDAGPSIANHNSAGEFKLSLFPIFHFNLRYGHYIYSIIRFIITDASLSDNVPNKNCIPICTRVAPETYDASSKAF